MRLRARKVPFSFFPHSLMNVTVTITSPFRVTVVVVVVVRPSFLTAIFSFTPSPRLMVPSSSTSSFFSSFSFSSSESCVKSMKFISSSKKTNYVTVYGRYTSQRWSSWLLSFYDLKNEIIILPFISPLPLNAC